MIKSLDDRITLNNGTKIPGLGLGVYQIPDEATATVVADGIKAGYRLIDTAQIYGNEVGTGEGIRQGLAATGLKREDIFVTSKLWNNHLTYDQAIAGFESSLNKLGLDYLDLYLIHWPGNHAVKDAYRALEDLYHAGKIKAIGVSNFEVHHLEALAEFATVVPVLNQVESHPRLNQNGLREYAKDNGIKIQAWSPLMQGQILNDATLKAIADKHHKSVAQIILRWDIQREVLLAVKSVRPERLASNAAIFDFALDTDDMTKINAMNRDFRVGPNPDDFDF